MFVVKMLKNRVTFVDTSEPDSRFKDVHIRVLDIVWVKLAIRACLHHIKVVDISFQYSLATLA